MLKMAENVCRKILLSFSQVRDVKRQLIRYNEREAVMSRRRSGCEELVAFSNLPESSLKEPEIDVKMLDRNNALWKMVSWEMLRMLCC